MKKSFFVTMHSKTLLSPETFDPELPDYILLLLTNRKPKREMIEELNVFLPKSKTESLVDWLFGEIEALKSKRRVPTDSPRRKKEKKKKKKSERRKEVCQNISDYT